MRWSDWRRVLKNKGTARREAGRPGKCRVFELLVLLTVLYL